MFIEQFSHNFYYFSNNYSHFYLLAIDLFKRVGGAHFIAARAQKRGAIIHTHTLPLCVLHTHTHTHIYLHTHTRAHTHTHTLTHTAIYILYTCAVVHVHA